MVTLRLKIGDLAGWYQKLGARLPVAAMRGAVRGGLRAVSTLQRASSAAGPANPGGIGTGGAVNTGNYKRSWKSERTAQGARVFNVAKYAGVIEYGRRAGRFPPLSVIQDWAQRRLGLSRAEAARAAFPIARAIARRGLRGRQVMGSSLPNIAKEFIEEVEKELARELTKLGSSP